MILLEDKRSEFVRRAAMHSSRRSLGQVTSSRDGPAPRTLLRKRVSYPLSSKALGASNTMSSTLPARKLLTRKSMTGLSSSSKAVNLTSLRKNKMIANKKECDQTENSEPNCSPLTSDNSSSQVRQDHIQASPMKALIQNEVMADQSPLRDPGCSLIQTESEKFPILVESNSALEPITAISIAQEHSAQLPSAHGIPTTGSDSSSISVQERFHAERNVTPVHNVHRVFDGVDSQEPELDLSVDLPEISVCDHAQFPMRRDQEGPDLDTPSIVAAIDDKQSASGSVSPSSIVTSSAGSEDLNRIVEIFRNSVVKKRDSRPSSTPQSPSSFSSNRSICSPVDEQRIQDRLIEDEWKRRARVAEDALAKIRLELHQAESTYEEVLKKCAAETKEAVCKLNKSLEDEQAKVVDATVKIGLMQAELERAQLETNRARNLSRFVNLAFVFLITIIIYDIVRRPSSFCS